MVSPMSGKGVISPARSEQMSLRDLEDSDLDAAHGLSVAIGWPHRRGDWRAVFDIGRGYCAHDAIGRLAGTAMWWPMGTAFAAIGMVIVAPGLQGHGLGRRLMHAVLGAAHGRTLQLNATAAGMPLYASQGFQPIGVIQQHQGIARTAKVHNSPAVAVRPCTVEDFASVAALDRAAHGTDRRDLLRALTGGAAGIIGERDGRPAGVAFCRPFGRGHMIGPILAADDEAAIAVTAPLVAAHPGHFLRADIPLGAADFARFIEECGLLPTERVTTMIKGREPFRAGAVRVFGLVNQAIG
jgi:GNAT superfamily N-acetyltransferase